jgi:hypothetical protein
MSENLSRIKMRNTTVSGSLDGVIVITGYLIECEPVTRPKQNVLRPIAPDEPDTEVEVGYSKNALEPLTLVFRKRKIALTISAYRLFRYVHDLYRAEGQEEFEFIEITEIFTGDELGKSDDAIGKLVRKIATALAKITAPISVTYNRGRIYVVAKKGNEK